MTAEPGTVAAPATAPPVSAHLGWRALERHIAQLVLFVLAVRQPFHFGTNYGDVLAIAAVPLWIGAVRQFRGAMVFGLFGVVTVTWGLALAEISAGNHAVDAAGSRDTSMLLIGMLLTFGVILWARRLMSDAVIGVCFGLGMFVQAVLHPGSWADNPWKFAFAIPVAVLVLGASLATGRVAAQLGAAITIAIVSVVLDSRAYSAALALVALLLVWRVLGARRGGRTSRARTAAFVVAVAGAVYLLATTLLVNGYLGANAQQRSIEQIQASGSLILGGRPELAATLTLMEHRITGYGVGVVPTPNDVLVAKSGLASINYAPNNGYVERYMFGGHFELHSVLGDMWANWGLAGLAFVLVVASLALRGVVEAVSGGPGNVLTIYVCVWTLWNLAFSPLVVSAPILVLAVALTLRRRT